MAEGTCPRDKRKKKLSSVSANQHSVFLPECGKEINQSARDINKTTGQQTTLWVRNKLSKKWTYEKN